MMSNDPFAGVPPEIVEQIIALGGVGDQQNILKDQLQQAQALRQTAMPQGYQTRNAFVASNPLQHAGRMFQQYRGKKQEGQLRDEQQQLIQQQTEARRRFAEALGRMQGGGPPSASPHTDYMRQYQNAHQPVRT